MPRRSCGRLAAASFSRITSRDAPRFACGCSVVVFCSNREAAKPEESAVQPALLPVTRQSEESVSLVDAPAIVQSKQSRKKGQRQRRAAAAGAVADAGAAADARPAANDGAVADVPVAEAAHEEDAFVPEAFDASESQHGGLVQTWAVVQGLQSARYTQHNGRLVRVGNSSHRRAL